MKVKVTKKMTNELNKVLKCDYVSKPLRFEYREAKPEVYERVVNYDLFKAYDYGDFDWNKSVFKYIAVVYPGEYYAMSQYLTTYDLNRLFAEVKHDNLEFNEFANHVINSMSI